MKITPLKRGTKQLKRSWLKRKPPKRKAKVPTKTKLRNKCDKLVGALCRSLGKCEICGNTENLQWCHFITRAVIKLRYLPKNYACLCSGCHFKAHDDPKWITDTWDNIKGKGTAKWLSRESNILFTMNSPIIMSIFSFNYLCFNH